MKTQYKRTLRYLTLQKRDFNNALAEINEAEETHPLDYVLRTHLYAITGQKDRAKAELEKTQPFRQYKVIDNIAHLLNERFELTGPPTIKRRAPEVLDIELRDLELDAILLAA